MRPALEYLKEILALGMSGFVMYISTSIVQIVCNISLARYGGDLYIGVMTVLNSIREIVYTPLTGLTNGAQPVIGYNYGAKEYARVKQSIRMMTVACRAFTLAAWAARPAVSASIHPALQQRGPNVGGRGPRHAYLLFRAFYGGVSIFRPIYICSARKIKEAIFFSTLRKLLIVVPLTLILPMVGNLDANGVFLAEPISNFISGAACYATMYFVVWKRMLSKQEV